ncbi:hypothetical protein NA57DRAFT_70436 [Rhizodiscina lignyota]|uniref:Capsule polysaccharide biosynthesis protein n=1 Tax=Rhizodiscina lignyota TaxID=1504668 RepID=A0A9P4IN79_9PEZI|nr:hypothetical protein NA57DRAFT_70436 [Rhizodiscina lignyota]
MNGPKFPIPEEFRSQVHHVDSLDNRSDEEILHSLTKPVALTSEKNIWTYWHAGVREMSAWCQRNVFNWIRLCGPSWSVRVLDNIPDSPNNALKWVTPDLLPDTFVKGTMDGPYVGPHSADFLRGACLQLHGGVWMDVGCILIRSIDMICWKQLEDPESPFEVSCPWMYGTMMANHFVASRKGNQFIEYWHKLFIHLWQGRTNPGGILQNPLVQFGSEVKFEDSQARNFHWDFKVDIKTVMEYIGQVLAWLRLCMLEEPNGFNAREYYGNRVPIEDTVGFTGQQLFNVLATRLDAQSEEYKAAYKTIWRVLTRATMQKITHGKNLTKTEALGVLWDKPENEGKDIEPGTFAELLRYGSVYFEQDRKEIDYVKAEMPDHVIRKGLLEP